MLEEMKNVGELVAAHRPTPDSAYIEGVVQKVLQEGEDFFYQIAWEDGKHFGEVFYEGELEEIDLEESEAVLRTAFSSFSTQEEISQWLQEENAGLRGLTPQEALSILGLKRVTAAYMEDYIHGLYQELEEAENQD